MQAYPKPWIRPVLVHLSSSCSNDAVFAEHSLNTLACARSAPASRLLERVHQNIKPQNKAYSTVKASEVSGSDYSGALVSIEWERST